MAITRTTLSAAIDADERFIRLGSTTNMLANDLLVVGNEIMLVNRIPVAGTAKVQRGVNGTKSIAHTTGASADFGQHSDFGAFGAREVDGANRGAGLTRRLPKTYNADGAISIQEGMHILEGSDTAYTLAAPSADQAGVKLMIIANAAAAFVLTATGLLRGDSGATDDDVATFGGAIGDFIELTAFGGIWLITAEKNQTMT